MMLPQALRLRLPAVSLVTMAALQEPAFNFQNCDKASGVFACQSLFRHHQGRQLEVEQLGRHKIHVTVSTDPATIAFCIRDAHVYPLSL